MVKIQVLGRGLIPRGLGLAPRKEPFKADLRLIQTILATPGLKVRMVHPLDGHMIDITNANLKSNWDRYSDYKKPETPMKKQPAQQADPIKAAAHQPEQNQNGKGQPINPTIPVITKHEQENTATKEEAVKEEAPVDHTKQQTGQQNQSNNNNNRQNYQKQNENKGK